MIRITGVRSLVVAKSLLILNGPLLMRYMEMRYMRATKALLPVMRG